MLKPKLNVLDQPLQHLRVTLNVHVILDIACQKISEKSEHLLAATFLRIRNIDPCWSDVKRADMWKGGLGGALVSFLLAGTDGVEQLAQTDQYSN